MNLKALSCRNYALKFIAIGLCFAAGSTLPASANTFGDVLVGTIGGESFSVSLPEGQESFFRSFPFAKPFVSATVYLTEPASEPNGSTIQFLNGEDVSNLHISDILTLDAAKDPTSGELTIALAFVSDSGQPIDIFPVLTNAFFVEETGRLQDLSTYFFGTDDETTNHIEVLSDVSAVPLPATLPLFASGLAGLGWLSRRKKRCA